MLLFRVFLTQLLFIFIQSEASSKSCQYKIVKGIYAVYKNLPLNEDLEVPNGSKISFRCLDGLHLVSKGDVICVNGQWSNKLPTCHTTEESCQLKGYSELNFGKAIFDKEEQKKLYNEVLNTITDGGKINYTCDTGYLLYIGEIPYEKSSYVMYCNKGRWSGHLPVCKPESCQLKGYYKLSFGKAQFGKGEEKKLYNKALNTIIDGGKINYTCDIGYLLYVGEIPYENSSYLIYCKKGRWSGHLPVCKPEPVVEYEVEDGKSFSISEDGKLQVSKNSSITFKCLWLRENGEPEWIFENRFTISNAEWNLDNNSWNVHIRNILREDEGHYSCKIPSGKETGIQLLVTN